MKHGLVLLFVLIMQVFAGGMRHGTCLAAPRPTEILKTEIQSTQKKQNEARAKLQELRKLMQAQTREERLAKEEFLKLEKSLKEMSEKLKYLNQRIETARTQLRSLVIEHWRSKRKAEQYGEHEDALEIGKQQLFGDLVSQRIQDIEALKIDLSDAQSLENRIQEDRDKLRSLFENVQEKENVLALEKTVQIEILRRKHSERLEHLRKYREMKESEARVETLLKQFSARVEFQKLNELEEEASRSFHLGSFSQLRGKLEWPIQGRVVENFGRVFDPITQLHVFKKGVLLKGIEGGRHHDVQAVFSGRVAYAGALQGYGQVVILDHGGEYYSLYGNLEEVQCKIGDFLTGRGRLGIADRKTGSVYFEIRSKNVPVNPLQWIAN